MILWGKIEDFGIFSILQFLASHRKTGVIEIQDFEEYGFIYLSKGRVDGVSLPFSDDLLGRRLVAAGLLTPEQLKECLLAYNEGRTEGPLGAALLARSYTDRRKLQEVVNQETYDQILQLSNWTTGTFKFVVPEKQVSFRVKPSIDVQSLLLETYRRLDEGEKPRREKIKIDEEVCFSCTLKCNAKIKQRFLKSDVCLWRNMPAVVRDRLFDRPAKRRSDYEEEEVPFL